MIYLLDSDVFLLLGNQFASGKMSKNIKSSHLPSERRFRSAHFQLVGYKIPVSISTLDHITLVYHSNIGGIHVVKAQNVLKTPNLK